VTQKDEIKIEKADKLSVAFAILENAKRL